MASWSRIGELAAKIQVQAAHIETSLSANGYPPPTIQNCTSDNFDNAFHNSRNEILEAVDELTLLVQGPLQFIMNLAGYTVSTFCIF